jgi:endonuclease/exonuclease/phosphatase family metal-dependent hydrolase
MKVVSINIEYDKHLDLVIPFIQREQPDVLCLQELLEKNVDEIAEALGYVYIYQASSYSTHHLYPDQKGYRQGVGIFAKRILASGRGFYLGDSSHIALPFDAYQSAVPNSENERAMVWADIEDSEGTAFRFATAHLPVTEKGATTGAQIEAAERLIAALRPLGEIVLCGDMNAPRGQATFGRMAEAYADSIPKEYTMSIDCSIHRNGEKIREEKALLMVDGLFLSPSYQASDVHLAEGVSDHMAIVATITKKGI